MEYVLGILLVVLAAALIACVLMQSGKGKKLSSTITGSSDTFFSKGKAKTNEKKLSMITTILAVAFVILTLVAVIVITVII
ncbi:MAG: preprotein translocase subunit SecG [Clostridia bacterium]|nr:preprotein translocase subunit SecG [Clostridia bacterium]